MIEKHGSIREWVQYRINKKNCECFRTDSYDLVKEKLTSLRVGSSPNTYTLQKRSVRVNKADAAIGYWTPWSDI